MAKRSAWVGALALLAGGAALAVWFLEGAEEPPADAPEEPTATVEEAPPPPVRELSAPTRALLERLPAGTEIELLVGGEPTVGFSRWQPVAEAWVDALNDAGGAGTARLELVTGDDREALASVGIEPFEVNRMVDEETQEMAFAQVTRAVLVRAEERSAVWSPADASVREEYEIARRLARLTQPSMRIGLVTGTDSLDRVRRALTGYTIVPVDLSGPVPSTLDALLLIDAPLDARQAARVSTYLSDGGSVGAFGLGFHSDEWPPSSIERDRTRIASVLEPWGVHVNDALVATSHALAVASTIEGMEGANLRYPPAPLSRPHHDLPPCPPHPIGWAAQVPFPLPTAIEVRPTEDITADPILATGGTTWLIRDLGTALPDHRWETPDDEGRRPLLVALRRGDARLAVSAAHFLTDDRLDEGYGDAEKLFASIVDWLALPVALVDLPPRECPSMIAM